MSIAKRPTAAQIQAWFATKVRITVEIEIAPKLAEEWASERNLKNRAVRVMHTGMLVRAMTEGRWRLTHQGIAFDRHGHLIDGQHRLMAIAQSGVAVPMQVTFGADIEDMGVCDTQSPRTPKDLLTIFNGRTHGSLRTAILRVLLSVEHGVMNRKADNEEILREDLRHNNALTWFIDTVTRAELAYAPFAAALVYAYERKPRETAVFAAMVIGGSELPANSGALRGYELAIKRPKFGGGGGVERMVAFRKMLRAISLHCTGKRQTNLADGEEGLKYFARFPVIANSYLPAVDP